MFNKKGYGLQLLVSIAVLLFVSQNNLLAQTFSTKSSSTFPSPAASARVVVADFDNDDDGDILYQTGANGTAFRFARSNGNGTFTDQAISASPFAGVTLVDHNGSNYHVADFDRDGDMDIWAGVNNTTGSYYRNDNGVFTTQSSATFPAPAVSSRAVTGDFDKDGDADFLYQTGGNGTAFKYSRSNGNGTFTDVPLASSPFAGVTLLDNNATNYHIADFDGDGDVDVWAGVNGAQGSYYRNDNGTFTSQSTATFPAPLASGRATTSDYDTDGDGDILYQTGGNGTAFQYARNNGNGTFTIVSQAASPFASVTLVDHTGYNYYIEDFDNDDDMDVWAAGTGTSGTFYSKDDAPPNLASFTPANNAAGVSTTVNITYTFDQSVVKGTGNIYIVRISDNTIVETIPVTGTQVTGSGTTWTIDPSITLAGSTQYAVKSDAGTFKNAGGTIFGGVSLSNAQSFKTVTTLNSVTVPANGTYKAGGNLNFSVSYSENITVTGSPFIPVTIGSTVKNAAYISGSGTGVLNFRYTIVAGDLDIDGITVGSAISLNGGTIKDGAAVNAPLSLSSAGATNAVLVDAVAPSVSSITRVNPDNTNAAALGFSVAFSESVSGIDISDFTLTTTGTATGTIASVSAASGTTVTVTVNGVAGNGTLRLDLASSGTGITDGAGNAISGGYTSGQTYAIVQPSISSDYFRTVTSGNWNSTSTWQSSTDNITYHAASLVPDFNANSVTILNPHTVTVTANVTADQITINNGGAVTVSSGDTLFINDGAGFDITVNGSMNIQGGGSMKLKSTAAGTASVGTSSGTITGNVTVERYIPSRRAWRLMTAPVSNSNTIYQAWQNSGVSTSGAGTYITAPGGGNGLDNGNTYSLKTYNTASQVLENVTSTNVSLSAAAASAANKGYFLFVRGDRTPANLTPPNTNITTLSSIGSLQTGAQTFAASGTANNFTLIGNPYASPVDFSLLSRNNVAKRFYAWDPALNTVGGYVLLDDMDDNGTYSITPSSSQTNILQSGQAVFVQTLSDEPATVTFNESSKSDVTASAGFRTNNGSSEIFRTNLYLKNADSTTTLADGVLSEYNNIFSPAVTMEDGAKMENINENLAIARSSKLLALERRPLVDGNDTLFLNLTQTTARAYSFEFVPSNIASVVSAWLEDTYLKTSTPLSVTSATQVDFSVTSDAASATATRFRIVFKTSGVLPVNFTNVKAYEKNAGIQVDWKVAAESNIRKYEAEKSADGRTFEKLADVAATGNNNTAVSYGSFDVNPVKGNNFYRIKVIENSGKIRYSQVVNVKIGSNKGDIVLYPNPVKDRVVYLQLNNQPKGKYVVELLNALGQRLFATTITHLGGSASQTIQMPSVVSKGIYQLKIKNGENAKTQQIIFE